MAGVAQIAPEPGRAGFAGAAILVGGVTLYFTLTRPKSSNASATTLRVGGGPGSLFLNGTF